jgi:hypothetical protein
MALHLELLGDILVKKILEDLKDEAIKMLADASFLSTFTTHDESIDRELWSKGAAYSIVPFELEMSGVTPSKMSQKVPVNKKNAHRHCYVGSRIDRIEVYNSKGEVHEVERFLHLENRVYAFSTNRHAENLWLKIAEYSSEGSVIRSCRVDNDSEFWSFAYDWDLRGLKEITSFSSNSVPGVKIYPEYNAGFELQGMYFLNAGSKVYVYRC